MATGDTVCPMVNRLRLWLIRRLLPELPIPSNDVSGLAEVEVVIGRDSVWVNGPCGNLFRATRVGRISFRWEG